MADHYLVLMRKETEEHERCSLIKRTRACNRKRHSIFIGPDITSSWMYLLKYDSYSPCMVLVTLNFHKYMKFFGVKSKGYQIGYVSS